MGIFFGFGQGCKAQDEPGPGDRQPAVAGRFYPGTEKELKKTLSGLFADAAGRMSGDVRAVVCPHAGYVYSGKVAAAGYNQIDPKRPYERVFIIASSHHAYYPGVSVYNAGNFVTPLGMVTVDTALATSLIRSHRLFSFEPEADRKEHSLEVQVPFLQYHLTHPFTLVPLVMGTQSAQECRKIAEVLKPYFNERNLFVISTDFAHYPTYNDAVTADKATCDAIVSRSPAALMKFLTDYEKKDIPNLSTNLCGWTSVLTLLYLLEGDPSMTIKPVQYMNSGDSDQGNRSQVVGYWSMVVTKEGKREKDETFAISDNEKMQLLMIARRTVEGYCRYRRIPESGFSGLSQGMTMRAGAFVTLREHGELRGCIGRFTSEKPLYELVQQMSVASSTEDPRFSPVREDELEDLEVEISVLSPMKKITSVEDFIPGKHGIYIKKGNRSGTFLPQVAGETGWSREELLGHCSRDKAGIGWDGWKEAELFIYEAVVFSEQDFNDRTD